MLTHCCRRHGIGRNLDIAPLSLRFLVPNSSRYCFRHLSSDGRNRLSSLWTPTTSTRSVSSSIDDPLALLVRAGFLRQAYSGIFHLLPLGLRVQRKLEKLIEKYMRKLGASKLSLSSISSESLWEKTGRLEGYGSELFHLDKKNGPSLLLSPTHEEEITQIVAKSVRSYKELPLRLYQISRKYRDERRPRGGLLRAREFVMKDLYTFDSSAKEALATYQSVRLAYDGIFDELKVPYLVAEADPGAMGGDLSHEYHFFSSLGEDNVVICDKCSYAANVEKAQKKKIPRITADVQPFACWTALADNGNTLVNAFYPVTSSALVDDAFGRDGIPPVNIFAIKAAVPSLDASIQNSLDRWKSLGSGESCDGSNSRRIINVFDASLRLALINEIRGDKNDHTPAHLQSAYTMTDSILDITTDADGKSLDISRIQSGDFCPRCPDGVLAVKKAVELAHTFHLGTRYSGPLGAHVNTSQGDRVAVQMGCHGIGVSRLIGTLALTLSDERGLNWPKALAPYDVVILPRDCFMKDAVEIYDLLASSNSVDPIIDDRCSSMVWKLKDADLIGYPLIIIIGKNWQISKRLEIQCRRLGKLRLEVGVEELLSQTLALLSRL